MWARCSHTLAPLTNITSIKVKFKWNKIEQDYFDEIQQIVACDTLSAYPDFNEEFKIHTDARKLQLGAVIRKRGKPIAFYSRKLTYAQKIYTVTENEILSIVETLKEFRTILLGQRLRTYADHRKLTCKFFNTYRVFSWIIILEEYGSDIEYIQGDTTIQS